MISSPPTPLFPPFKITLRFYFMIACIFETASIRSRELAYLILAFVDASIKALPVKSTF